MTRQDFQLIARTIRQAELTAGNASYADCQVARAQMARAFAVEPRATNPRFDRERFLTACRVEA